MSLSSKIAEAIMTSDCKEVGGLAEHIADVLLATADRYAPVTSNTQLVDDLDIVATALESSHKDQLAVFAPSLRQAAQRIKSLFGDDVIERIAKALFDDFKANSPLSTKKHFWDIVEAREHDCPAISRHSRQMYYRQAHAVLAALSTQTKEG